MAEVTITLDEADAFDVVTAALAGLPHAYVDHQRTEAAILKLEAAAADAAQ